jgi:hypothetical protein
MLHQSLYVLSLAVKQHRPWAMGSAASMTSPDNIGEVTFTAERRE